MLSGAKQQVAFLVAALLLALTAVALAYALGGQSAIMTLGYPGIFLSSMISAASLFIPLPLGSAGIAVGSQLDPPLNLPPFLMIGIAGGLGSAFGEFSGYLAGRAGERTISESRIGSFIDRQMQRWGGLAVFTIAAVPNPFVDLVGIAAGATGMPPKLFITLLCPAKVINHTITAYVAIEGATFLLSVL